MVMEAVALNHKVFGEGKPLVIVHGLFGSLDNWQTHAKTLSEYFQVILVDARNHGHSPHVDEHTYDLMAADLLLLLHKLNLEKAHFIGHSMGGKAVIRFAQLHPEKVDKLIVADMGLKAYPPHHELILKGLNSIDFNTTTSRSEAEKSMSEFIQDNSVRQFLLKNLYWIEPGKRMAWRMNIAVLEREMPQILMALPQDICSMPTLFLRGALSNYVLDEDLEEIEAQFPNFTLETIDGAGHWVHAERPKEFLDEVLRFLIF
jgi:esterase